jgi:hypothetical protein
METKLMFRVKGRLGFALRCSLAVLLCTGFATAQGPTSQAQPHPKRPRAGPQVTAVTVRPVKFRLDQPCPVNPTIFGTIQTNGVTTVTYQWVGSGGKTWPKRNLKFTAAGTQSVTVNWKMGSPGKKVDEWIELQILSPNRLTSNKVILELTCGKPKSK